MRNVAFTANHLLSENLLYNKALLHAVFASSGPFHAKADCLKKTLNLFAPVICDFLTLAGRTGTGKQNFTVRCGRQEKSLEYVYLLEDAFLIAGLVKFVKTEAQDKLSHSLRDSSITERFGIFLTTRNASTRTLFMFLTYFQIFNVQRTLCYKRQEFGALHFIPFIIH